MTECWNGGLETLRHDDYAGEQSSLDASSINDSDDQSSEALSNKSDSWMKEVDKKKIFTVALINEHSLIAKLDSFRDTLNELGVDICLLTETWFKDTNTIKNTLEDFNQRHGYHLLRRDRRGTRRGGGVAVCYRTDRVQFTKAKILPSNHEIFAVIGRRTGQRKKIAVIVVYVPPHYNADQNRSLYKATNNAIHAIKSKYDDPYIIYGGDFNRRSLALSACDPRDQANNHPSNERRRSLRPASLQF